MKTMPFKIKVQLGPPKNFTEVDLEITPAIAKSSSNIRLSQAGTKLSSPDQGGSDYSAPSCTVMQTADDEHNVESSERCASSKAANA
jgi:hypothetical protein